MIEAWTVQTSSMVTMGCVAAFTVALPLALAVFFRRRTGGRWRFFLLGCAVFPLFVLVLERAAHALILDGPAGAAITGNIWLYGLYGGLMAGLFEESGRAAVFLAGRRWLRGPQDALLYGAGHGGIEAVLVAGLAMVNNLVIAVTLNRGGLEAVDALMGPLSVSGVNAVAALTQTPASLYLWSAFERLTAVGIQVSLSVLVYAAVKKKGGWYWFPVAVLLHAGVDFLAVVTNAFFPIAVTELAVLAFMVGAALLARHVYRRQNTQNA